MAPSVPAQRSRSSGRISSRGSGAASSRSSGSAAMCGSRPEPGQLRDPPHRHLERPVGAVGERLVRRELVEQRGLAEQVAGDRQLAGRLDHRDDLPELARQLDAAVGVVVVGAAPGPVNTLTARSCVSALPST